MIDLSLVSLDDMIDEIERRHDAFVIAVCRSEEGNEEIIRTWCSEGRYFNCVGLVGVLQEDIFKHYKGSRNGPEEEI